MSVVRTKREPGNYFQAHKGPFEDQRLSWKAKGILAYLFTRPGDWEIRMGDLIARSTDGRDAVRSGLAELVDLGYATRERTNDPETGKLLWVITVSEIPSTGFPSMVNPSTVKPMMDKSPPTKNKTDTKNKGTKNDTEGLEDDAPGPAPLPHQLYFARICQIVGVDHTTATKSKRGQVGQTMGYLQKAGYTIEELDEFRRRWASDWRWQKHQSLPTLAQLRDEIGIVRATVPTAARRPPEGNINPNLEQYRPPNSRPPSWLTTPDTAPGGESHAY